MISNALVFLKNYLNTYLETRSGRGLNQPPEDKVVFIDGEHMDPVSFKLGAVSALLINIEEENILRSLDPYTTVSANGGRQKSQPDIRLNLYILFVARFKQYEQGLRHLSLIIQCFQTNRVLDQQHAPELSDDIDQLVMELVTLPFSEQNEVWNALRTTYHPSVLYKVKMLVFRDEEKTSLPVVQDSQIEIAEIRTRA